MVQSDFTFPPYQSICTEHIISSHPKHPSRLQTAVHFLSLHLSTCQILSRIALALFFFPSALICMERVIT